MTDEELNVEWPEVPHGRFAVKWNLLAGVAAAVVFFTILRAFADAVKETSQRVDVVETELFRTRRYILNHLEAHQGESGLPKDKESVSDADSPDSEV